MFGKKKLSPYTDFTVGIYKVIMFRKIAGIWTEIDRKEIKVDQNKFRYENKKDFITIDLSLVAFKTQKNNYYAFDFDTGTQLTFNQDEIERGEVTLEEIDEYVNRGIISDIVAGLEQVKSEKGKWIMVILVGIMAGFIGGFIGYIIRGNISAQIILLLGAI